MRIPLHCTIGAHSAAATRLLSLARSLAHLTLPDTQEGELASTPPREDVVLLMLILLAHRSGREAEHAEYVQGLPRARDLDSPLVWTPEQMRLLRGTGVPALASDLHRMLTAMHSTLQRNSGDGEPQHVLTRANITYAQVVEAWLLVSSRHFSVYLKADIQRSRSAQDPRAARRLLVPVLDTIDHCSSTHGTGRGAGPVSALARNAWYIERGEGDAMAVTLVAGQPIQGGAKVCHSYSRGLSASGYLLRFGFIPEHTRARAWVPLGGGSAGLSDMNRSGRGAHSLSGELPFERDLPLLSRKRMQALALATGQPDLSALACARGFWLSLEEVLAPEPRGLVISDIMCYLRVDAVGTDALAESCRGGDGGGGVAGSRGGAGGGCCREALADDMAELAAWRRLRSMSLAVLRSLSTGIERPGQGLSANTCGQGSQLRAVGESGGSHAEWLPASGQETPAHEDVDGAVPAEGGPAESERTVRRDAMARAIRAQVASVWSAAASAALRHIRAKRAAFRTMPRVLNSTSKGGQA